MGGPFAAGEGGSRKNAIFLQKLCKAEGLRVVNSLEERRSIAAYFG